MTWNLKEHDFQFMSKDGGNERVSDKGEENTTDIWVKTTLKQKYT